LVVRRWRELLEYRDILLLLIEEAGVICVTRQGADVEAAEDTVPVAGYRVVSRVAQNFWQELQEGCDCAPESS